MFDITLQIGHMEIERAEDHIQIRMHPVLLLPVGNGQAMPVPFGVVRVPMALEAATNHANEILAAIEGDSEDGEQPKPKAQKPSSLVIANSMQGVDKVAEQDAKFRGK